MDLQQIASRYIHQSLEHIQMAINALEMIEEKKPIGERNYSLVNYYKTVWVEVNKTIETI